MTSLSSLRLSIDPEQIYFFKFILEGYDGLALLSTVDRSCGLVEVRFPEPLRDDLLALIESMRGRLSLVPVA